MDKFKDILKQIDPDGKIFTESVLKDIFDIVEGKKTEAVEKALLEYKEKSDAETAKIIEEHKAEVAKIATENAEALKRLDEDATKKLEDVVAKFDEAQLNEVSQKMEAFIDACLLEAIPEQTLIDKVKFEQVNESVEKIKRLLVVNDDYVKKEVQEAITEAKTKVDEKTKELDKVLVENIVLKTQVGKFEAIKLLESKTKDMPDTQRIYMTKLFENADSKEISERFDEAVKAYEKELAEKKQKLVEENKTKTNQLNIPNTELSNNKVIEESKDQIDPQIKLMAEYVNKSVRQKS